MRAEMKSTGILLITAENDIEAYSLRKWAEENLDGNGGEGAEIDLMLAPAYPGLMLDWSLER